MFNELVKKRYSVRSYKPDPLDGEVLEKVLDAACLAPTAVNKQPFKEIIDNKRGKYQ